MTVLTKVLDSALPKVATNGWRAALTLAIREHNLSDQAVSIFPNGQVDLVTYWLEKNVKELKTVELHEGSEQERVKQLLSHRLRANSKIGPFLGEAQSLLIKSPAIGSHHLASLSDELWWLAGDRSTDSVWYTRRGTLGAIYASAELVQRADTSKGYKDTIAFASRQVDRHYDCEVAGQSVLEWAKFNTIAAFNVARSLTR